MPDDHGGRPSAAETNGAPGPRSPRTLPGDHSRRPPAGSASEITITPLQPAPHIRTALSEILIEVVANGGSVSFMHPLAQEVADTFWEGSLAAAARGERIVLGAYDGEYLVGTVTLLLNCPPNQPHRAEIAKLMTRVSHRGRGVATALMQVAEQLAVERARTLLVLDTAVEGGAASLYERLGFTLAGIIPDYAFTPRGELSGTMIYWKRIGGTSQCVTSDSKR
jgi:ribosomal protein S18 acetylase RimI-like enzyme